MVIALQNLYVVGGQSSNMQNPRFYAANEKYTYDVIIARKLEDKAITEDDSALLTRYIKRKLDTGQIEPRRATRLATALTQWRRFLPEYKTLTYEGLLDGITRMKTGSNAYNRPYTTSTQRSMIKTIKTFITYLVRQGIVNITRDDVEEIKYPKEVFDSVKPSDLLSNDKVEALIGACPSMRDKAIVAVLVDTGLRPVDLCGLKWEDLDITKERIKISVTAEKTTESLSAYVILHQSWVKEYRRVQNNPGPKDWVFLNDKGAHRGEPMSYIAVSRVLQRASKKSGVTFPKGAQAKLFRAGSITRDLRDGISTVATSRTHFGSPDSRMLRHYAKLVDEDTEREKLAKTGAIKEKPAMPVRPDGCPECGAPLSPGAKFCADCGTPLTGGKQTISPERRRVLLEILSDPELAAVIEARIRVAGQLTTIRVPAHDDTDENP